LKLFQISEERNMIMIEIKVIIKIHYDIRID